MAICCFTSMLAATLLMSASAEEELPVTALTGPEIHAGPVRHLELEGIEVTPHLRAQGLTYAPPTEGPLGARIQFFVRNASAVAMNLNEVLFDFKYPLWMQLEGDWSWHDTPNIWPRNARAMPPDALSVWTINVVRPVWTEGDPISLVVKDWNTDAFAVIRAAYALPEQWISSVTFPGGGIHPERLVIHVTNDADEPLRLTGVRLWLPEDAASFRYLYARESLTDITTWPADGIIPPNDSGILIATSDAPLPLTYAAVEVGVETGDDPGALWGYVRVKPDVFDVAGGWINSRARDGSSTLLHEPYLKALKQMYVNAAHIGNVPGYNDAVGSGGLYDRFPIKQFGRLTPLEQYDKDAMIPHIHGAELLGEPQLPFFDDGLLPHQVYEAFVPYASTRLPTTITLSDERSFRHYAGLSDYPHYDAYRVIAPGADRWTQYDRWPGGERIGWGAPLESIGELSRVLRDMSRPRPCAIWSQGPHEGWYVIDGRTRLSPTAEELRSQAYHALATRIISLYWFNLSLRSITQFRDTLEEITRIGREMYMLESFYMEGDAYRFETLSEPDGSPDWELSSIIAPHGALLFALDVDYAPDHDARVFRFNPPREARFRFALPLFLREPQDIFRVDADGVHDVSWAPDDGGVVIQDRAALAAVYVATPAPGLRESIEETRMALIAQEEALGFDPANNDDDFAELMALLPPNMD